MDKYLKAYDPRRNPRSLETTDFMWSFAICTIVAVVMLVTNMKIFHWFIIPVIICGCIIGADAVRWFKGGVDTFDPKGLIGCLGFFFFFLSPLLYIHGDLETPRLRKQIDWATWIGIWATLNIFCLIIFNWMQSVGFKHAAKSNIVMTWRQSEAAKMLGISFAVLVIATACQALYLFRFGGIAGIISEKENPMGIGRGLGPIVIIGNSLPIIMMIVLTLLKGGKGWRNSAFLSIVLVLCFFFAGQFLVGGLTGSRSRTLLSLMWAGGIVHYFWRPFKARHIVISLMPLLAFMYIMGFYKDVGSEVFGIFTGDVTINQLEHETGRSISRIFMGDLSRCDLQAYELNVMITEPSKFDLRWGKTYLLSGIRYIPSVIWKDKPLHGEKVLAGIEMSLGKGNEPTTRERGTAGSRVWGIGGESIFNFGPLGPLFAYAIFGYILGRFRGKVTLYPDNDLHLFIIPQITIMLFTVIYADADNLFHMFIGNLLFPMAVLFIMANRYKAYAGQEYDTSETE